MFCYCFDEDTKKELENKGLKCIGQSVSNGKTTFVFANDSKNMTFDKSKVIYTDKLMF